MSNKAIREPLLLQLWGVFNDPMSDSSTPPSPPSLPPSLPPALPPFLPPSLSPSLPLSLWDILSDFAYEFGWRKLEKLTETGLKIRGRYAWNYKARKGKERQLLLVLSLNVYENLW